MHRSSRALLAVVVGIALTAGVGCGDSDEPEDGGAQTGAESSDGPAWLTEAQEAAAAATEFPTTIPAADLGAFTPEPDKFIFHVGCDQALEGCARFTESVGEGSKAIGYRFKTCDGGSSPDTIQACFDQAVNAKPDAITVNAIEAGIAAEGYGAAEKAGIPVIGILTGNPPGEVPGVITEVGGELCELEGNNIANWVIADSDGEANVLFVGTQTFDCNVQRMAAVEETMGKCETCTFDTLEFAIDSIQTSLPKQLQAALQRNPDLTHVIGTFDAIALAAVDAVRQAGKGDTIKVAGFDGDAPNLELLRKQDIQAADATNGFGEDGWVAVDAAARHLAGEEVGKVSQGTHLVLDWENISNLPSGQYNGAPDYQAQFKELWGK